MTVNVRKLAISTIICLFVLICLVTQLANAQSSERNGYINHGEIIARFKSSGNAIVTENIYYVFDVPSDTLLVPLVSYKLVNPSIPVDLAVWSDAILSIRDGHIDLVCGSDEITQNLTGLYPGKIDISLPTPSTSVNASLTYELENVANLYPFSLSGYEIRLDPLMPAKSFSFTMVFDDSIVSQPYQLHLDSALQRSSRGGQLPSEIFSDNNSILINWTLHDLVSSDYPLRALATVSGLPGMAFGGTLIFADITAFLLAFSFEIVYYLSILPSVGPYVKLRRKIALRARIHPFLMLLTLISWLLTDLVLRISANSWGYSWVWVVHCLAFGYWSLMLIFWPLINTFDYIISRRKSTTVETTGARFVLWMKREPRLLGAIFLHEVISYLFLLSMLVQGFNAPILQGQLFLKEPWFFALMSMMLAMTSFLLFKIQNLLVKQQETVNVVFNDLLDHPSAVSLNENVLAKKCLERGISVKSTKLAVESLVKIDGLISRKEGMLSELRKTRFVIDIEDPDADQMIPNEKDEYDKKIIDMAKIFPEMANVRVVGTPAELFGKTRIEERF